MATLFDLMGGLEETSGSKGAGRGTQWIGRLTPSRGFCEGVDRWHQSPAARAMQPARVRAPGDADASGLPAKESEGTALPTVHTDAQPTDAHAGGPAEAPAGQAQTLSSAQGAPSRALLEESYRKGEAAGRAAALAEIEATQQAERALRLRFGTLDSAALEVMEEALAETVLNLCGQLMESFAIDQKALNARCREAAKRLGAAASQCTLQLNPQDICLLDAELHDRWQITENPELERGSVLFEGADGQVSDGPLEWRCAIAEALGLSEPR